MRYKFLLKCRFYFSKLVTTFFVIMYNLLIGQGVVTDIIRDEKGNIFSIKYYGTFYKKLELLKIETFHLNGHVSTLKSLSSGLKNGLYKEFYDNGNIKIDGQYSYGDKSGLWCEYFREGGTMRVFYANGNRKNGSFSEWHKSGKKKVRGQYFQGEKHGLWTAWYSNGVKESLVTFNQGEQKGIFSYFYDNGNKKSEGTISYRGKKEQRCWDMYGNTQNCIEDE